ncbi:hypothetical protein KKHLCK_11940 [Candidatus Electrothrix laxa]
MPTANNMTNLELVQWLGDLIVRLNMKNFGPATDLIEVRKYDELCNKLAVYLRKIVREGIRDDTKEFISHTKSLKKINKDLLKTLDRLDQFAQTLKALVDFVGVVEKLLNLAAPAFGLASPVDIVMERTAHFSGDEKSLHRKGSLVEHLKDIHPPQNKPVVASPVKNAVEEVLHGIELTDEKLIITVATGGCTGEGNFHIHVDKGYTKLPPYQVTVYRVVSDDCHGHFDPIKISFSRKKLGLDGNVDFIVRNRIGNTSQHRLPIDP